MTAHAIPLEQEWEIFARYEDHYHLAAKELLGVVYASTRRAAVRTALREFGEEMWQAAK